MPNLIITRVMYCDKCHKAHRPIKGDLFVTVGRTRQKYQVREVSLFGQMGYTPHIIEMKGSEKGKVAYTSYCAIDGCGSKFTWNESTEKYSIICTEYATQIVTLKEWNALVLFKDDPDFWLD